MVTTTTIMNELVMNILKWNMLGRLWEYMITATEFVYISYNEWWRRLDLPSSIIIVAGCTRLEGLKSHACHGRYDNGYSRVLRRSKERCVRLVATTGTNGSVDPPRGAPPYFVRSTYR